MQNLAVGDLVFRELQLMKSGRPGIFPEIREFRENFQENPSSHSRTARGSLNTRRATGRLPTGNLIASSVTQGPHQSSFYRHIRFFVSENRSGVPGKSRYFPGISWFSRKFPGIPGKTRVFQEFLEPFLEN